MKRIRHFLGACLGLLALVGAACAAETPAAATNNFSPIAFLVGGVWRGELPPGPGGQKVVVESKFEWTANHQAIRFESAWLIGGQRRPHTAGMYVWNPEKRQLAIFYSDAEGSYTEGLVEVTRDACLHTLRVISKAGVVESVQTRLTHPGANAFANEIFTRKNDRWEKLVEVHYTRGE